MVVAVLLVPVMAIAAQVAPAGAADGDVVASYGNGGLASLRFPTGVDVPPFSEWDSTRDANGDLVVAAMTPGPNADSLVLRYLPNGVPDTTFGGAGFVSFDAGNGGDDAAKSIAVQHDGKIVVGGEMSTSGGPRVFIARLLPDGGLDRSFASGGIAVLHPTGASWGSGAGEMGLVDVGGTQRIYIAAWAEGDRNVYVERLDADGSPDYSYGGGDAIGVLPFPGGRTVPYDLAVGPDGGAYVGVEYRNPGSTAGVGKLTVDGVPATTWGGNGDGTWLAPPWQWARSIDVDPSGHVAVALHVGTLAVALLDATGAPMAAFGSAGIYADDSMLGFSGGELREVRFDASGRILVLGGGNGATGVARLLPSSAAPLDPAFGGSGHVSPSTCTGGQGGETIAVSGNTAALAASCGGNTITTAAVDGTGAVNVGWNASTVTPTRLLTPTTTVTQPDGKVVVAATAENDVAHTSLFVARFTADGALDKTFHGLGWNELTLPGSELAVGGAALDPAGALVVAGGYRDPGIPGVPGSSRHKAYVARFASDGTLDGSFAGAGWESLDFGSGASQGGVASAVVVQPVGTAAYRLVVVGSGDFNWVLAGLDPSGAPDLSFGGQGTGFNRGALPPSANSGASAAAVTADGKIVAAGASFDGAQWQTAVARFAADGTFDPTFHGGTPVLTQLNATSGSLATGVAVDPAGNIAVSAGESGDASANPSVLLFGPSGSPATTFGTGGRRILTWDGGVTTGTPTAIAFDALGRIVVTGTPTTETALEAVRLTTNGANDTSFGGDGIASAPCSLGDGTSIGFGPTGDILVGGGCNHDGVAAARFSAPTPLPVSNVSLTADRSTALAGAKDVSLSAMSDTALAQISNGTQSAPVGSIPVGSIPVGSIPVGSIPVGSINLASSPVGSIPVGSIPVGSIPVGSIGFDATLVSSLGLPSTVLDALFAPQGGVTPRVAGLPLQTLTVGDLEADPIVGPRFRQLSLRDSGLAATMFGRVGLASLLLGGLPLASVPVPDSLGGSGTTWCDLLATAQPGFDCGAAGIVPSQHSFIGASLAAAPVGSIPVGSIPVGSIPVGSIPVGSIPVGSIDLASSPVGSIPVGSILIQGSPVGSIPVGSIPVGSIPVGSIPVGSIAAQGTPVGSIPVGSIAIQGSPVGSIPVGSIATQSSPVGSIPVGSIPVGSIASILTCAPAGTTTALPACPSTITTLADAVAGGYLATGAQLWMLAAVLTAWNIPFSAVLAGLPTGMTFSQLGSDVLNHIPLWTIAAQLVDEGFHLADLDGWLHLTLGQIPDSAWGDVTLFDVLIAVLVRSDFPWEDLPIDGMQDIAPIAGNQVTYTASGTVACPAGARSSIGVDLGDFRYQSGTAQLTVDGASATAGSPARDASGKLVWQIGAAACTGSSHSVVLKLKANPGFTLGVHTADLAVTAGFSRLTATGQAPVTVQQNGEPDTTTPRTAAPDSLVIGHIAQPGDVDTITVPMPAKGTRVRVFLSHIAQGADFDLTVGMPSLPSAQSAPVGSIPVGSIAMEDDGREAGTGSTGLPAETLQDMPVGSIPVGSISANRGSQSEVAQVVADGGTTPITIQVSGYNGSWSGEPYVLRVKEYAPVQLQCAARPVLTDNTLRGTLPATSAVSGKHSLFLLDLERMRKLYGATRTDAMLATLNDFAARPEVAGLVVPVDGSDAVRAAFNAWDADPCSIDAANAVVRQITQLVGTYRSAQGSTIDNVVLYGTDEAMPFARVPDLVTLSNEQDNASDLGFTLDADGKANALYAAAALGYILTDDAYTAFTDVPWLNRTLYLPQVPVSRLVETPEDISGQIAEYTAANGILDTGTATTFTTGYDFLADGSQAVGNAIDRSLTPGPSGSTDGRHRQMINETWTKTDLTNVVLSPDTSVQAPTIDALNAHFSHKAMQPAGPGGSAGSTTGAGFTQDDLVTTQDVTARGTDQLVGRLLFTMGCHAGLNVADTINPTANSADWAQTFAGQRAAVYLANTGYGYGDSVANALSERLMTNFANAIDDPATTVGQKMVLAKQQYFATMGSYGVFDEKALIEATLYGLPYWRVAPAGTASTAPAAVPQPALSSLTPANDADAGLPAASVSLTPLAGPTPQVTQQTSPRGTYWAGPGGAVTAAPYRPLQPVITQNVNVAGATAHGVLITGLTTTDTNVADFARALPTVDDSAHEPEPQGAGDIFPANLVHLATSKPFGFTDQRLVVVGGQSRADTAGPGGVERLVSNLNAKVLYGTSTDFTAPGIDRVDGVFVPGSGATPPSVTFEVHVANGVTDVHRVTVLYKDSLSQGVWHPVELTSAGGGLWTARVDGISTSQLEIFAQAQDNAGNVGYSTNKGSYFNATFQDKQPPAITILSPVDGSTVTLGTPVTAGYACADPSGVTTCAGPVPSGTAVDTTTPGPRAFTVNSVDSAGNATTKTVNFVVQYGFGGFQAPVSSTSINRAKAGSTVPVKFVVDDVNGTSVSSGILGQPGDITSQPVKCPLTTADVTDVTATATTSSAGLKYDPVAQQWVYTWNTDKAWTGTCRQFNLKLADGITRTATFQFTK